MCKINANVISIRSEYDHKDLNKFVGEKESGKRKNYTKARHSIM